MEIYRHKKTKILLTPKLDNNEQVATYYKLDDNYDKKPLLGINGHQRTNTKGEPSWQVAVCQKSNVEKLFV